MPCSAKIPSSSSLLQKKLEKMLLVSYSEGIAQSFETAKPVQLSDLPGYRKVQVCDLPNCHRPLAVGSQTPTLQAERIFLALAGRYAVQRILERIRQRPQIKGLRDKTSGSLL